MPEIRQQTTDNRELKVVGEIRNLYNILFPIFKKRKDYFLWQHGLKSLISVGSNLTEGNKRSKKEQLYFISIAEGSMAEFEFQLSLMKIVIQCNDLIDKIKAMIYKLKSAVRNRKSEVG